MTKIILVNSCRECPNKFRTDFLSNWVCNKYAFYLGFDHDSKLDTIHPDCKLDDLPEDMREKLDEYAKLMGWDKNKLIGWSETADFANFVINKITKQTK